MTDSNNKQLQQRIDELERRVKKLENRLDEPKPSRVRLQSEPDKGMRERATEFELGDQWLNRLGIGLLLLGVLFLFKFSVDQGWLTPPVRTATGLAIGLTLLVSGLRLGDTHKILKQLLIGGGIAAFYITGFATFQLYDFLPDAVIWMFMIVVTLLSLSLSLQQDEAILSVVGIAGGLGTPFMLYGDAASIPALVAYTGLVLAGGSAIYWQKGWKALLWTMTMGAAAVLVAAYFDQLIDFSGFSDSDRWALQVGVLFFLVLLWVVPVVRQVLMGNESKNATKRSTLILNNGGHVSTISLLVPVLALSYSISLWELSMQAWGVISMASSLLVGYAYLPLRHYNLPRLASTHGFVALILLTISFFLIAEGSLLLIILAMEGLGLRMLAHNNRDRMLSRSSHVIFGLLLFWIGLRIWSADTSNFSIWEVEIFSNLLVIMLAGLAAPFWISNKETAATYRLLAHIGFLAWLYILFLPVANGQAWVSVSWCLYGLILLMAGFFKSHEQLRLLGTGTVFLVVGKLFLIDLSQLQAVWRILLFIGFGAVFLLIGYYVKKNPQENAED